MAFLPWPFPSSLAVVAARMNAAEVAEANRLREELPPGVQAALTRHEQVGTTSSQAYQAEYRCRRQRLPPA